MVKQIVKTINSLDYPNTYWNKIIFYSTEKMALSKLKRLEPKAQIFLDRKETLEILLNHQITKQQVKDIKNFNWIGFEMQRTLCEQFTLGENCAEANQLWTKSKSIKLKNINPNIHIVIFAADSLQIQLKANQIRADYIYMDAPINALICQ